MQFAAIAGMFAGYRIINRGNGFRGVAQKTVSNDVKPDILTILTEPMLRGGGGLRRPRGGGAA